MLLWIMREQYLMGKYSNIMTKEQIEKQLNIIRMLESSGEQEAADEAKALLIRSHPEIEEEIVSLRTESWLAKYITQDTETLEMLRKVRVLSTLRIPDPVFIIGETGTGKEIIANALHGRRTGHFVAVNTTALPPELMESELFGHIKGAFTGADKDRIGKIQAAHNGTLFLDEIGDMPHDMQAKLLRTLQDGNIVRLGSNEEIPVKFRLVAATNKNVEKMIEEGKFREDLYWRMNRFVIRTKPLRERPADVPLIIKKLCPDFPSEFKGWKLGEIIGERALRGNYRELETIVRRWQILKEI